MSGTLIQMNKNFEKIVTTLSSKENKKEHGSFIIKMIDKQKREGYSSIITFKPAAEKLYRILKSKIDKK